MASGGIGVVVHLCALALKAGTCPLPNILVDACPHEPGGDQPLSSPNTRVVEVMEGVKHLAAELWGD